MENSDKKHKRQISEARMKTLEEIDQELIQIQEKLNQFSVEQQRLLGYRQALLDLDNSDNDSTESTRTS